MRSDNSFYGTDVNAQRKFRMTKDRAEEQLSNSYSKSITISPTDIEIRPSVQGESSFCPSFTEFMQII
jgi:hypothetical protein